MNRGATWVVAASFAGHLGNFGFYMVAGRIDAEGALAVVTAMTALAMIVVLPASGYQAHVAAQVARHRAAEQPQQVVAVLRQTVQVAAGVSAVTAVVGLVATPFALGKWDVSAVAWWMTVAWLAATVALQIGQGTLQGLSAFGALAVTVAGPYGVLRVLGAAVAVAAGGRVAGVMGALVVSSLVGLAIVGRTVWVACTRPQGGDAQVAANQVEVQSPWQSTVGALLAFGVLTNIDTVLAPTLMTQATVHAEWYAAAALMGKLAFHVPAALALVMLPMATERVTKGEPVEPITVLMGWLTVAVGAVGSVLLWVLPGQVAELVFGSGKGPAVGFAPGVAVAMTAVTLLFLRAQLAIARGRVRALTWWLPVAAVWTVALLVTVDDPSSMVRALLVLAGVCLLCMEFTSDGLLRSTTRLLRGQCDSLRYASLRPGSSLRSCE